MFGRGMLTGLAALLIVWVTGCTSDHGASDGGVACVDFDASTYDKSCQEDSDCINVNSGTICETDCLCGNDTINADAEARYNAAFSAAVSSLPRGQPCSCPFLGSPHCIQQQCVYCPNPAFNAGATMPPGCPDAG